MVVEGTYVALIPDISGPADATLMCADEDVMRKLLAGELNPFIASMRRLARLSGNRGFGTRVALGLQAGSPFAADAQRRRCHEPRHRQHPGWQHLRRQRSTRRSRRLADGEPRAVPGRHALSLPLDPHRRRHPPEDDVRRRAGLLQGSVLRGGDDRDDLRRLPPVGGAPALRLRTDSRRRSRSRTTARSRSSWRSSWRSRPTSPICSR